MRQQVEVRSKRDGAKNKGKGAMIRAISGVHRRAFEHEHTHTMKPEKEYRAAVHLSCMHKQERKQTRCQRPKPKTELKKEIAYCGSSRFIPHLLQESPVARVAHAPQQLHHADVILVYDDVIGPQADVTTAAATGYVAFLGFFFFTVSLEPRHGRISADGLFDGGRQRGNQR